MDKNIVILVSAFSGLLGALLTQLMTGLFAFINDRRKQKIELAGQYRTKKLEIGENFFFINGEQMTMMRKNIDYWQNLRNDRSEETLQFMKKQMDKLDNYQSQLQSDNWKYNLVGVYFLVPFSFEAMQQCNRRTHQLYIMVTDLSNKIRASMGTAKEEEFYKAYNMAIFDLISHYEQVHVRMQDNMVAVKTQLLAEFGQPRVV